MLFSESFLSVLGERISNMNKVRSSLLLKTFCPNIYILKTLVIGLSFRKQRCQKSLSQCGSLIILFMICFITPLSFMHKHISLHNVNVRLHLLH